jgi:diguanylate cyclase (GGDEF)-like protein/PAS domain S-box-containing protein
MRVTFLLNRANRWGLALGLASVCVTALLLHRFQHAAANNSSHAEAGWSLSIVADMVLTISYFILAGAFISMYRKSKDLLQIRGIFLIFALFMTISGVSRILGLLAMFREDPGFSAQAEMISATLAVVSAGIVAALVGRTRDFLATARRSQQNEARFMAASESSLDAFYTLQSVRGSDGQIIDFEFTYLNSNGEKLIGLPREEIIGQYLCALIPVNRSGGFFDEYKQVVMSGQPVVQEFPMELEDDIPRWIRHEVVRLEDGIAISAADITERKLLERAAQHRAQHDVLTGLPNRSLLNDRVQQAIDRAIRYKNKVGLFVVDMDMFKEVNDSLGHAAGDLVLVTAAQRLRESIRGTDSVLRIGGDEFIVVMPDVQQEADIRRVAAKVTAAISNGGPVGLENIRMSCSIGIAIYPTQAANSDELFSRADAAMYEAKRRGGGCFEIYSEGTPGFSPQPRPVRRVTGPRPALVVPRKPKPTPLFPDA